MSRVLHILGQIVFAVVLIAAVSAIWTSILGFAAIQKSDAELDFLSNRAGFDISEHPAWYSSNSSYGDAFRVGLENSLRIIGIGLVLTTILGILGGILLLSTQLAGAYDQPRSGRNPAQHAAPGAVDRLVFRGACLSLPLFQEAVSFPQEAYPARSGALWSMRSRDCRCGWRLERFALADSPRRALLWNGLIAAIVALEIAFHWVAGQYASGRLDNPVACCTSRSASG